MAAKSAFDADGNIRPEVSGLLKKAVERQMPLVEANLRRARRSRPNASPAEIEVTLEKQFLATVTSSGAAIGVASIMPGVGTAVGLGLSAGATIVFLEASALYALSVAALHNIHVIDPDGATVAVMAIMLGEEGTGLMQMLAGRVAGKELSAVSAWGSVLGKKSALGGGLSNPLAGMVAKKIQKMFIHRMVVSQGGAFVGRVLPMGIGAVVGGAGNLMLGKAIVKATKLAFGPPPMQFQGELAHVPAKGASRKADRGFGQLAEKATKAITSKLPSKSSRSGRNS